MNCVNLNAQNNLYIYIDVHMSKSRVYTKNINKTQGVNPDNQTSVKNKNSFALEHHQKGVYKTTREA